MAYGDERPCACGSLLRQLRCCSLDLATLPPAEAGRHLLPLVERAIQARRQGADSAAERLCLEVLELLPGLVKGGSGQAVADLSSCESQRRPSFFEKRSKKLLFLWKRAGTGGRDSNQKFFGSFFQKRTAYFRTWHSSDHLGRVPSSKITMSGFGR